MLVDLELDYQIQLIAREFICIAQGGGTVIAMSSTIRSIPAAEEAALRLSVTASEKGISADWLPNPNRAFLGRATNRYNPSCDCARYPR